MADFERAFRALMADEVGSAPNGGYVNDPADKGGETKYGISKRAYPNEDIKNLTEVRAKIIYRCDYWDRFRGDYIANQTIADALLDVCVNNGLATGIKLVQLSARVTPADGVMGAMSIKLINQAETSTLLDRLCIFRIGRYATICTKNPTQKRFLLGWINRALNDSAALGTTTGLS